MAYDISPTWEKVGFDEEMTALPSHSSKPYRYNPLDKEVSFVIHPKNSIQRVKYNIFTGKYEIFTPDDFYIRYDLYFPEANTKRIDEIAEDTYGMDFICAQVIGDALVYRQFEIRITCHEKADDIYECSHIPIKESRRYVFYGDGIILETRDKKITHIEPYDIQGNDILDIYDMAGYIEKQELYEEFKKSVKVAHKDEFIRALGNRRNERFFLRFRAFLEAVTDASRSTLDTKTVPERILHELSCRAHSPDTALKIAKDLCVVIVSEKYKFLGLSFQKRAYFDSDRGYFFRQSAITKKWSKDEPFDDFIKHNNYYKSQKDMGIFKDTCMEKYLKYAVINRYRAKDKIDYKLLMVQNLYLAAEQAAKMESPTFKAITDNICNGLITDTTMPLTGVFGVTGHQLKFLEDITIPHDISSFGELMNDEEIMNVFPDVKKRIFAVSFYLGGYWRNDNTYQVTKAELLEAAQTLSSIEKLEPEKREHIQGLYRDYILMRRRYLRYKDEVTDSALHAEIMAFGDAPINVKPSRIKDMHDKLGKIVDTISCAERIKDYTEEITRQKIRDAKEVEYYGKEYAIILPEDAMDIIREGRILCHCVGHAGYIESMAAGRCRILFLRKISTIKKPLITMEERDGAIVQCYGYRDSINTNTAIRDFIEEYASIRNVRIEARTYQRENK